MTIYKEKRKKGLAYKSAFETTDDPYNQTVPILTLGENGIPGDPIKVDLKYKDIQAYWQTQEPKLWLIVAFCSIYFLFIMLTYGV